MTTPADELEAIRRNMAAYNMAGDRFQLQGLADTFMENGVLETSTGTMVGRAAIVEGLGGGRTADKPPTRRPTFVRHNLTTSAIDLTGPDTAAARTYFIVYTDIGADHMGHYTDKLRKVNGQWLFEHRRVLLDWMAENTLFESQVEPYRANNAARIARSAKRA